MRYYVFYVTYEGLLDFSVYNKELLAITSFDVRAKSLMVIAEVAPFSSSVVKTISNTMIEIYLAEHSIDERKLLESFMSLPF